MRLYRRYRCDHGHEWTVVSQEGTREDADQVVCPNGHEAVTCNEELPADEVQIVVRPASRVADRVTGAVLHAERYYLVLLDRADRELCASRQHLSWDEAIQLSALFRGKSASTALDWWRRKDL